jgi:hypothetical protein
MDPLFVTRRHFFSKLSAGLGGFALSSLLSGKPADIPGFAPKAKRVIYLFMSGGPAQQDLFDDKPLLRQRNGEPLPDSVRAGQRLTGMSGNQAVLPLAGSHFKFMPHGKNGTLLSELLPHTGGVIDDICLIRSMFTEAINHDPAMTFFQTGSQIAGRPSLGSWIHYGLGSMNENLPAFVVLVTKKPTTNRSTRACGAAVSWTRAIRECGSHPARRRFSIWPIRMAFAAPAGARCWTNSPR